MTGFQDIWTINQYRIIRENRPDEYPFREVPGEAGPEPVYGYDFGMDFSEMSEDQLRKWISDIGENIKIKWERAKRLNVQTLARTETPQ